MRRSTEPQFLASTTRTSIPAIPAIPAIHAIHAIHAIASLASVAALALVGCGRAAPPDPTPSRAWASSPAASALLTQSPRDEEPAAAMASESPTSTASAAPSTRAGSSAALSASAALPNSAPSEPIEFAKDAPSPKLRVYAIGLHIGGGPNDDATKEPIHASVAPHLETMKRCWPWVDAKEQRRAGDFGVDLLIEAEGGHAKVENPRGVKGEAFHRCMVGVFSAIEFKRPKTGKTLASYSIHFAP